MATSLQGVINDPKDSLTSPASDLIAAEAVVGGMLVVEDNADDLFFLQKAVSAAGLSGATTFVQGGSEAIEFLERGIAAGNKGTGLLPKVVLLDLAMPRVTGFDVLTWMGTQKALGEVPVIVFMGVESPEKLARAMRLGAKRCYIKSQETGKWVELIREVAGEFGLYPIVAVAATKTAEKGPKEI